jgi:hypothetical protein
MDAACLASIKKIKGNTFSAAVGSTGDEDFTGSLFHEDI